MYPGLVRSTGLAFAEKSSIGIEPINLPDRSRWGNHGTHHNITMVQLPSGLWMRRFNGSSSKVLCGADSSLDVEKTNAFSLLIWAKLTESATDYFVIGKQANVGNRPGYFLFTSNGRGDTVNFVLRSNDPGTTRRVIYGDIDVVDGTWHLLLCTKRAGTGHITEMDVGVDGAFDARNILDNDLGNAALVTASEFSIGVRETSGWMNGDIARPRFLRHSISEGQFLKIFEAENHWFGV